MDKIHFNRYIHPFETIDEFFLALYIVNKMQSDLFSSHDIHQAICSTIIQITFKESTDFVEKIKGYKYHYPSNLKYKLHDIDEHIEVTEHFNVAALQSHSKQKQIKQVCLIISYFQKCITFLKNVSGSMQKGILLNKHNAVLMNQFVFK